MRQVMLLAVLLLGVSWAAAQNYPNSSTPTSGQTSAGTQTTVEGCLSGSDGKYTLTDSKGTNYQLTGDTAKLADHVGHEVKITGVASGSAASSDNSMAAGAQTLEVSSMKHVSKTCKNGGGMSK